VRLVTRRARHVAQPLAGTGWSQQIVDDATHDIQFDRPDVVIDAVVQITARIRG
jgi:hypothetical protein